MRTFHFFLMLITLMISSKLIAQDEINVLVTIDDINIEPTFISNSVLKVDSNNIELNYKLGRFQIMPDDYRLLKDLLSKSKNKRASLSFMVTNNCPKEYNIIYNIQLDLLLFLQDYLLLKIYNFKLYPNVFASNKGYGFEYISPIVSESLPRKKKQKKVKHCSD